MASGDSTVLISIPEATLPGMGEITGEAMMGRILGDDATREAEIYKLSPKKESTSLGLISGEFVQHGDKDYLKLLRQAYQLAKDEEEASTLEERLLNLESPVRSTILHIAACYGNERLVDEVIHRARYLVIAQNYDDDTPFHFAARAGHFSTLQKLFQGYLGKSEDDVAPKLFDVLVPKSLLMLKNKKGNTILHDTLINKQDEDEDGIIRFFDGTIIPNGEGKPLSTYVHEAALESTDKDGKSALYLAIEVGYKNFVIWILDNCSKEKIPQGKSPLLAAIMKQNLDMLKTMIERKPEWIHLMDEEGRIPLHWAASTGYLGGVDFLLQKCGTCSIESDKNGFYALHLASEGGHLEVLKKLLDACPDPREIVDNNGRNILHIAAERGKLNVVKHILRDPKLEIMITDMDADGNTPLHLATLHRRPKVVYALTWHQKVNLRQMNLRNQTALDINLEQDDRENQPLRQRLVWSALKSAGTVRSPVTILPQHSTQNSGKVDPATIPTDAEKKNQLKSSEDRVKQEECCETKKGPNLEQFKDRVDTLIVVSTLIITATFAGGFSLPGGSDNGIAVMLNRTMFQFYIYCITISMYGAISVTLILIWARLGDISLLALSLQLAKPLLGITVVTLSLAFLAGVYLVISPLGWLAASFLIIATIGAVFVALLYIVLWLPSKSRFIVCQYMSYIPFHLLASVAEGDDDDDIQKGSKH